MYEVVLHIGLHKTATGTLQRQFFPACSDLNLLTTLIPEMRKFVHYVVRCDPIYFDRKKGIEILSSVLNQNRPNMLSNESFSGPPYAGAIEGGLDHRSPVLTNLKAVFPQARVILVLRRQDAMVKSFYRQYLKSGGTRKIPRCYGLEGSSKPALMSLDRFNYFPYVDEIIKLFPAGVLILAFEEFVQSQHVFLKKLTEFIGINLPSIELKKENATSLGPVGMEITRMLNHLFRSLLNPAGLIPGYKTTRYGIPARVTPVQIIHDKWPSKGNKIREGGIFNISNDIFEKMKDQNKKIDEKYGLGLSSYGYY
jgi:hypothetical protein